MHLLVLVPFSIVLRHYLGMLWLFVKKISLKAMLRKRAFMTIGTQADGVVETSSARKPRASHSKLLGTSLSTDITYYD
jgi:hypothetical protein